MSCPFSLRDDVPSDLFLKLNNVLEEPVLLVENHGYLHNVLILSWFLNILGDLGQTYNSLSTLEHYMQSGGQTVLFVGDLSYADRYQHNDVGIRWDSWGRFVEPSAAYQPWIWSAGNHEIEYMPEMVLQISFLLSSALPVDLYFFPLIVQSNILCNANHCVSSSVTSCTCPFSRGRSFHLNHIFIDFLLLILPQEAPILFGMLYGEHLLTSLSSPAILLMVIEILFWLQISSLLLDINDIYLHKICGILSLVHLLIICYHKSSFFVDFKNLLKIFKPAKYTPQWRWLREELTRVDRDKTPWLIVLMHAPIYNSNLAHYMEGESMRTVFESWFVRFKVDLIFAGHVHAYERSVCISHNPTSSVSSLMITFHYML